jgi:hypothetical protein
MARLELFSGDQLPVRKPAGPSNDARMLTAPVSQAWLLDYRGGLDVDQKIRLG